MKPVSQKRSKFRVGDLAAATGVTVRTLHHYEETGLIQADGRTEGGHRIFDASCVKRIYQIRVLRELGLSLSAITQIIKVGLSTHDVLTSHQALIEREAERLSLLRARLSSLTSRHDAELHVNDLVAALEAMEYLELHIHKQRPNPDTRGDAAAAWFALGHQLRECMLVEYAPSHPATAVIAQKAQTLLTDFSNGDPDVLSALALLRSKAPPRELAGWDSSLFQYLDQALVALPGN